MDPTSIAIQTVGLAKAYGKTRALVDCNLSLPIGRVMALVGPNGAGKSTLLLLLVGLLSPTSGSVSICGHDPQKDRREVLRLIGFVSQDRPLYRSLTVRDTLEMGRRLSPSWNQAIALDRIEQLAIPLTAQVGKLSGGQQAQISLTLALGKEPSILILDEPMASLDPVARHEFLQEVIAAAAKRSLTVIMSSHIVAELGRVCDYLAILRQGRLLTAGPISEVLGSSRRPADGADAPREQGAITDLERVVLSFLAEPR